MRRIQRDIQHEELIKELTTGDSPVFSEIWRVLLFAAAYGVMRGQRTPLEKTESNKAMPPSYFTTPGWKGFLYLIGFAESECSDHLKNDEEQQNRLITAFEEYANFGLAEISRKILSPASALEPIINMLLEHRNSTISKPDIAGLI
jgi:dnd system-associated protein 4